MWWSSAGISGTTTVRCRETIIRKRSGSSPDLERLANWATRVQTKIKAKYKAEKADPEAAASVPPPPMVVPTTSAARSTTTSRTTRTRRSSAQMSDSDFQMVTPLEDVSAQEKIKELEEQLDILKAVQQDEKTKR